MQTLLPINPTRRARALAAGLYLLLVFSWTPPAPAQAPVPMVSQSGTFYAAITRLFGEVTGFSAKAEMSALETNGAVIVRLPMTFALLDGKMRMDIDVTDMKSARMPPSALDQIKRMSLEQMTILIRPDRQMTLMVYPRLKSFVETAMTQEDKDAFAKAPHLEKTVIGKETIDGHVCQKYTVLITEESGKKHPGMVWMATDLKNFPLQMQFAEADANSDAQILFRYKNVQLSRPDPSRFDPPGSYIRYTDFGQLMQVITQKLTGKSGAPGRK
jgi:hypothetical protein